MTTEAKNTLKVCQTWALEGSVRLREESDSDQGSLVDSVQLHEVFAWQLTDAIVNTSKGEGDRQMHLNSTMQILSLIFSFHGRKQSGIVE